MTDEKNVIEMLDEEIEAARILLHDLRIILHNSQPEAVGKIRLELWKTSANDKEKTYIFTLKNFNSRVRKFQERLPRENILKKLKIRGPFKSSHQFAKETMRVILNVIDYRDSLVKKRSEIIISVTNLLRPNSSRLARNRESAIRLNNLIYDHLQTIDPDLYNNTDYI